NRVLVFSSSCRIVSVAMLSMLSLLATNAKRDPQVGGSNPPPRNQPIESQWLADSTRQAVLASRKGLGEKSVFRLFFRPFGAEQHTKFLSGGPFIVREGVGVAFGHTVPAVPQALLANLLRDSQRVHRGRVRVEERMQSQ